MTPAQNVYARSGPAWIMIGVKALDWILVALAFLLLMGHTPLFLTLEVTYCVVGGLTVVPDIGRLVRKVPVLAWDARSVRVADLALSWEAIHADWPHVVLREDARLRDPTPATVQRRGARRRCPTVDGRGSAGLPDRVGEPLVPHGP